MIKSLRLFLVLKIFDIVDHEGRWRVVPRRQINRLRCMIGTDSVPFLMLTDLITENKDLWSINHLLLQ